MISIAADLARRLARDAEAVCRHYLQKGRRSGRYWIIGDVRNTPGRSMFVRLSGPESGPSAAGHWTEYVAARVMLRPRDLALSHSRSTASTQHNVSAVRGGCVMPRDASELARRLARDAEAVCRHYLSNGRRQGRYWTVGDARNTPGRSMFVRLSGPESGPGAAGRWTDAASTEYGDLLDVIREALGLVDFKDVAEEARRFLSLPCPERENTRTPTGRTPDIAVGSPEAARRLFAMSQPISGTLVERYLRGRAITMLAGTGALRFHPCCYYRPDEHSPTETWPAMIAAVTDLDGRITGAHRTWLDPNGFDAVRRGKAPIDTQRKAMGDLFGHAVRFGAPREVMAAGEGIETMLSLRCALPAMPMAAALSASHLAALLLPPALRRLYIARDADAAGDTALAVLTERAEAAGIEALALSPRMGDFNEDLYAFGLGALRAALRIQLAPQDAVRFMRWRTTRTG